MTPSRGRNFGLPGGIATSGISAAATVWPRDEVEDRRAARPAAVEDRCVASPSSLRLRVDGIRPGLGDEAGYSLVELLVAIMLLSIAIIPMVGMFDAGLRAATTSSTYDEARSLANGRLEEVRSLPFANDTPEADSLVERYRPVNEPAPPVGLGPGAASYPCNAPQFPDCTITTTYVNEDYTTAADTKTFWVSVEVEVRWDGGNFTTTGLVAREI